MWDNVCKGNRVRNDKERSEMVSVKSANWLCTDIYQMISSVIMFTLSNKSR